MAVQHTQVGGGCVEQCSDDSISQELHQTIMVGRSAEVCSVSYMGKWVEGVFFLPLSAENSKNGHSAPTP